MIYLLNGENEFSKRQRSYTLADELGGQVERVDGEEITEERLRQLLFGQTLFDKKSLVAIIGLSDSLVWQKLPEIVGDRQVEFILLETKADKRTKTYKWLVKHGRVEEFATWGERDHRKAANWCVEQAKTHGFNLSLELAEILLERLGYDQLRLDTVLEQLSLVEVVDRQLVEDMVPLPKSENIFDLLKATVSSNYVQIKQMITYLEMTDGPDGAYRTLGLLTSQLLILNGLVLGGDPTEVAKDFSANPFVVRNVSPLAGRISKSQLGPINAALGQADLAMKTTSVSPWLILEASLTEIANICQEK